MEEEDSRIQSGCKTFRMGSDLCEILLKEYHSTPESYKDVRIRFEDGSVVESSKLLLGSLSELLFECLQEFPPWEAIEILAPGSNAKCLRQFLDGVFDPHLRSGNLEDGDFEDIIETFGFDAPPQVKSRLRAYYCEDCDSFMAKTSILSHIREFHPKSRTSISSPIWSYFDSTEHPEYHQCKECKSIIKDKTTNTSALIRHLEMQHPDSYEEYLIQAATNEPEVSSPIPTNTATTLERPSFKRRSIVWNYFSLSHLDPKSSSCNFCNKAFKYIGQTSSMIRHLKSEHADEYADYAQSTLMVIPETYKIESPETDNSDDEMMDCEDVVPVSTGMPQADEALFEEAKSSKKNLIWGYYERIDETDEFMCNNCDQIIDLKRKSVSDMIKHLKMEHPLLYYELTASSLSNYDKGLGISIKMGNDDEDSDGGRMDSYVEEEEEELETDEDDGDIYLPPNKRSLAWLYFETTEVNGINSCNLCSRLFKCKKNNTSIMLRHLKRAHPEVHLETKGKSKISTSRKNDEEKNLNNGKFDEEFEYFVDLFIPTEDDIALRECKACFKIFREENADGQLLHIKNEHPSMYEDILRRKQIESQSSKMSPGSKYKKRSLIWNHFDQTSTPDVNGCKYCPKVFKCKGQTTSSMIRHLKIEHKDVYNEFSALTASVYGRKIGESLQKFQIPAPPSIKTELDASGDEDNEEVLESVSVPNNSNNIIRPGKRRSSIWNYFVPTNVPDNNACKICNKVFKCKSRTTSSMIRHLKKEHVESFKEFLRFRDVVKSSESSDTVKKEPSSSKTDPIWNYFQKSNESKDVSECIECKIQIHAKSQLGIVSSMVTHLETTHADSYDTYCNQGGGGGGSGRVEEDSSLMCAECGDKFSNRASLTQHMKIAHAASCPYKCEECNASFTRRDSFEQHSHDKNKPRNYLCTICGKTFARRSIRNFHEKAHRAEKKYECGFCPKKFLTNQRKYKHERTHTGEKPYQCTECGRQFTQSHHLVTHARIHTGLKPYNCDLCPQTFRHLSSRNNHKCEGKLRAGIHDHLEEIHPLAYERFILQFNNDQESVMNFFQKGDLRRKSLVWDYFSPLDSNSETSACNLCLKVFRCKGQTFALLRHLKTEHFEVYSEFSQSNLSVIPPQSCKSEPSERREELESVSGVYHPGSELKKKSNIWNYFEKTDDPQVIACKDCSKDIVCKELSSLSNLVKHLKTDHNNSYLEYSEFYASKSDILSLKPEPQDIDEEDEDYPMASEFLEEEEVDQKEMEGRVEENNEVIHEGNNEIGEIDEDQEEDVEDEEVEEEQEDEEEGREEEDTNFQKLNKRKHSFFKSSETQGSFNCKLCSQEFKCKDGDLTLLSLHLKIAHPEVNIDSQVRFKPGVNYVEEEEEEDNEVMPGEFNEELTLLDEYFQSTEDDDALRECKSCYKVFREENLDGQLFHLQSDHQDIYAEIMAQRAGERDGEGMEMDPGSLFDDSPTKYKKRSLIWNYFKTTDVPFMNSCKFCSKVFKCKGQTTSSMIRHLKIEHLEVFEEFSALTASINGRRIGESPRKYFSPLDFVGKDLPPSDDESPQNLSSSQQSDHLESNFSSEDAHSADALGNIISSGGAVKGPGAKRRSSIWNYFVGTEEHEMNACRVCNRIFKCKGQTTSSMIRHLKKEHVELFNEFLCTKDRPRDPLEVSLSIKKEKKRSPIWNYYDKTESPGTNECRTCKKQFKCKGQSTFNMIRHLESNHPSIYQAFLSEGGRAGGEETQICAECGKQFTNRSALTQHMKVSHASSCPYKCEVCNATFTRRESYEQHSHDKNKPRNFLCTICGKTFGRRSIRDFHEKAHDAEKKYQCAYCPKKFLTNQRKYKHERTHTGEKPYQCTDCGRQFTLSHHLVTHSRIHTGQKPYSCDFCPQTFRHLSSRNNHKCEGKLRINPQS